MVGVSLLGVVYLIIGAVVAYTHGYALTSVGEFCPLSWPCSSGLSCCLALTFISLSSLRTGQERSLDSDGWQLLTQVTASSSTTRTDPTTRVLIEQSHDQPAP